MSSLRFSTYSICAVSIGVLIFAALVVSCGSMGGPGNPLTSSTTTGTVNTSIADPPACSATIGHVYVTVTKVTAHVSGTAGPTDSGWQTIVDLTGAPKQIDLLSLANTACVLTQLGSTTLPAGMYQQIRVYLLGNTPASGAATPSSNVCGSGGFNCVVPAGGSPEILQLSSEAQTGIKIPSSQISKGGLTVTAGQAVDLSIDFNTCDSLVHQGNGRWRLKPVLHAGELGTTNTALTGKVVDSQTQNPIGQALVSLEQPDPANSSIDIVTDSAITDANGNFSFCPLPAGATYDVVVTKIDSSGMTPVTYNATVTLNAVAGSALGNIPLVAEPLMVGNTTTTSSPATILGQVTTTSNSSAGSVAADATAAVITVSALQSAGTGKVVTIPSFPGSSLTNFMTVSTPTINNGSSPSTCPTGTKCENYALVLPASNPSVGTFAAGHATTYAAAAANPALYWIRTMATQLADSSAVDCNPPSLPPTFTLGAAPAGNQIGVDPPPLPDKTVIYDVKYVACTAGQ